MKKIKKGELAGLTQVSEQVLVNQKQEGLNSIVFPTKDQPTGKVEKAKLTPSWCCGDIEKCPCPCGACIFDCKSQDLIGVRIEYEKVFDRTQISAVMAQRF